MCSNPCESEVTCFRPESNQGPYGLLNFLCAALSTTELWWRINHRKSFRTLHDNQQTIITHFGENKRLHLESSKQNYYFISVLAIIKAIFIHTRKPFDFFMCSSSLHCYLVGKPTSRISHLAPVLHLSPAPCHSMTRTVLLFWGPWPKALIVDRPVQFHSDLYNFHSAVWGHTSNAYAYP